MLTIGAFAKASRLSAKALRLYDELGLLVPVYVDSANGYRFYEPHQLERARLVAWLRRLGMPLARIRLVCDLDPSAAAEEIAAYWAQVTAETAARREIAASLQDYLTGKATMMSPTPTTLTIRAAARSDIGRVRDHHEDAAHAGPRLLAVADGYSAAGNGAGERASAAAIAALRTLEDTIPGDDILDILRRRVTRINDDIRTLSSTDPAAEGTGTTLTAMLWSGTQIALVHIGDSRAYLVREGETHRLTTDHTYVQSLIDAGRLSTEEATEHPQRHLLLQAISGDDPHPEPDVSLHAARIGDRYLLCTDGVWKSVAEDILIATVLASRDEDPGRVAQQLLDLADAAGGLDNAACVVADVVEL